MNVYTRLKLYIKKNFFWFFVLFRNAKRIWTSFYVALMSPVYFIKSQLFLRGAQDVLSGDDLQIDKFKHVPLSNHVIITASHYAHVPGHIMEFGVAGGRTIKRLADFWFEKAVVGFDSFEGLPEDWVKSTGQVMLKKTFAINGYLPELRGNVHLVKGWFENSLPAWLQMYGGHVRFLHMDCDLYASAKTVLSLLNDRIKPGTVIVFDELYCWNNPRSYEHWKEGEYKALQEWMKVSNRKVKVLCRNRGWSAAVVVVQ